MGGGDRCCVGGCNNDRRYPERQKKRSHVSVLRFHSVPANEAMRDKWEEQVAKGRDNFTLGKSMKVCSNHFIEAEPTYAHRYPTLYLTESDSIHKSPVKRRMITKTPIAKKMKSATSSATSPSVPPTAAEDGPMNVIALPALAFSQLTRESDVHLHTGLAGTKLFALLFNTLSTKAHRMQYWKGSKQTVLESRTTEMHLEHYLRPGPSRKLTLEQEFLMVMMRLRMGLLVEDLAFRFQVSTGLVSSVFQTWIKLMRRELAWLIMWPSKAITRKNLASCFKRWYSKVRCIIDCTEVFIETPSSLDIQAQCYSDYKHHTTIKFLVAISPNGLITYVSDCYGGRASDKHIVMDCGFLDNLEPYDEVMADRGFKIRETLMTRMASLSIPPSARTGMQMSTADVQETSRVANVRIYVEQAIGRLKWFRILKNEMPMLLLPNCDDIVVTCCALCNLLEPLCV
jgi:hypothetical protein